MTSSLYVHIPFCLAKCDYCDFFSKTAGTVSDTYITALINEANYYKNKYSIPHWETIYIGGGTPSLLSSEQIERLLKNLSPQNSSECTIEMNPETLTQEKLSAAESNGVTRLSLGIQTLSQKSLLSVHRHCSSSIAKEKLELVKKHWKASLNLDAIAGLPSLSDEEFISSLEELTQYQSDHFSLYTLTVEEGTPLYQRIEKGEDFDFDRADRQWLLGRDLLEKKGWSQYEVSNFAKKGFESRHNMCYWKQENYVGIGSGATGTLYFFNEEKKAQKDYFTGNRWTNTTNIEKYTSYWNQAQTENSEIDEKDIPCEREILLSHTLEFEYLMMGLRTTEGVSKNEFLKRFKKPLPLENNALWQQYKKENKCRVYSLTDKAGSSSGEHLALTKEGLLFLNPLLRSLI